VQPQSFVRGFCDFTQEWEDHALYLSIALNQDPASLSDLLNQPLHQPKIIANDLCSGLNA